MQLTYWSFVWVIKPILVVVYALTRYVLGHGSWEAVLRGSGELPYEVKWTGPRGQLPWAVNYVQDQVRGRGEQQLPYDLLITDGVAVARLRHGAVRGRTNRHGFLCRCDSVHGSRVAIGGVLLKGPNAWSTYRRRPQRACWAWTVLPSSFRFSVYGPSEYHELELRGQIHDQSSNILLLLLAGQAPEARFAPGQR